MPTKSAARRAELYQERRAARIAAGMCSRCGKSAPLDGFVTCERCKDWSAKQQIEQRERFIRNGRCSDCGRRAPQRDRRLCGRCLRERKEIGRRSYANNRKSRGEAQKKYHEKVRVEVMERYGRVCQCCGEATRDFLSIDHINGNGAEERRQGLGGINLYIRLRARGYPPGYQVLCFNCNLAKGFYGRCPHEKRSQ